MGQHDHIVKIQLARVAADTVAWEPFSSSLQVTLTQTDCLPILMI